MLRDVILLLGSYFGLGGIFTLSFLALLSLALQNEFLVFAAEVTVDDGMLSLGTFRGLTYEKGSLEKSGFTFLFTFCGDFFSFLGFSRVNDSR